MRVFISYCGKEGKKLAQKLAQKMKESGIDAWTYNDPYYTYGDMAWLEIEREIDARDYMIIMTTECTKQSQNQLWECKRALEKACQPLAFGKSGVETLDIPELKSRAIGSFNEETFDVKCTKLIEDLKRQEIIASQQRKADSESKNLQTLLSFIRRKAEELPVGKVRESRNMIIERYLTRTIIRDVAKVGCVFNDETLQGKYIWIQDDAQQFKRDDVDYRMIWSDIADVIATGERDYLRQFILGEVKSRKTFAASDLLVSKPDFSLIEIEIDYLISKGFTPSIMLCPIQVFQPFLGFFSSKVRWHLGEREQIEFESKQPLTIYWSHKKLPSREFIIMDKNSVRWSIKPDEEDGALATAIGSPLYKDKVSFLAYTLFKVQLLQPEAISIIELPEEVANDCLL